MPFVTLNQLRYHYTDSGRPDAPVVMLLHGFTGSAENWIDGVERLADRYRVIAPDLLGHGQTDAPPDPARYAMPHAAADLKALIDVLDLRSVHLLGYSMGGRLALFTALTDPDRVDTLTLESASPGLRTSAEREERTARDNALADRIERNGIEPFVDFWESLSLWDSQKQLPKTIRDELRAQRLRNRPAGLANSLRGMGTGVQPSLWERLDELNMPVQLFVGQLDTKFVRINEAMAAAIPQANLERIINAGHTAHLERPGPVWETLSKALREASLA